MTHVFIVNERTFNIHLQYMFAGTGYKGNDLSCIIDLKKSGSTEKTLTGMIADISKLRIGDKVLFYVTGCKKIFGVFEVAGLPFYESFTDNNNYLYDTLGKNLTFRVLIKPSLVFASGISEQEALDEIHDIEHPYQMCWSLIYRKLSGMRGCSFLTDYESERIIGLISKKNNGKNIQSTAYKYDFKSKSITANDQVLTYSGDCSKTLDVINRICDITNSFEVHLQAYITQNYDKKKDLKTILDSEKTFWIGNEVVCSVGEQRIDVMMISKSDDNIIIRIIELKDGKPYADIILSQIPWYIKWVDQYVAPNYSENVVIKPIIIAAEFRRKSNTQKAFLEEKRRFNLNLPTNYNSTVAELEYISFSIDKDKETISFFKTSY
ncbi:MAG: DUF91 domain-containing protein [Clostridia bacterium]|nr:DUF91 domain-containing protein [Clostridia bacterium]